MVSCVLCQSSKGQKKGDIDRTPQTPAGQEQKLKVKQNMGFFQLSVSLQRKTSQPLSPLKPKSFRSIELSSGLKWTLLGQYWKRSQGKIIGSNCSKPGKGTSKSQTVKRVV